MLPLFAFALLSTGQQGEETLFKRIIVDGPLGKQTIQVVTPVERADPPRYSAKKFGEPPMPWEFDWTVGGYTKSRDGSQGLRFELWSQESTKGSKRPEAVVRLLMQLFGYNFSRMRYDHANDFGQIVSVFLCYGGEPGGEQLFEVQHLPEEDRKLNSIYLYDLRSFTDPVEAVREVAHEYGHATLPPVGGFTEPEDWANGYLGEKLYITYLVDGLRKGTLVADDVMGATADGLDAWKKKNIDPLVADAAINGPRPALLAGKSKASMDAFMGLALWTSQIYKEKVLSRALTMNGVDAKEFPASVVTAAEEPSITSLDIPAALRGKPVWIPIGKGTLIGAEKLTVKDGWVRIKPTAPKVVVMGPKR